MTSPVEHWLFLQLRSHLHNWAHAVERIRHTRQHTQYPMVRSERVRTLACLVWFTRSPRRSLGLENTNVQECRRPKKPSWEFAERLPCQIEPSRRTRASATPRTGAVWKDVSPLTCGNRSGPRATTFVGADVGKGPHMSGDEPPPPPSPKKNQANVSLDPVFAAGKLFPAWLRCCRSARLVFRVALRSLFAPGCSVVLVPRTVRLPGGILVFPVPCPLPFRPPTRELAVPDLLGDRPWERKLRQVFPPTGFTTLSPLCGSLSSFRWRDDSYRYHTLVRATPPYRVFFPAVAAAMCGRRCDVLEADRRGSGRTVLCEL